MLSRLIRIVLPAGAVVFMAVFAGCAGSRSSSSSAMEEATASAEPEKSQRLEDARRSAEDAEMKAHQMRMDKNRSTAKTGE